MVCTEHGQVRYSGQNVVHEQKVFISVATTLQTHSCTLRDPIYRLQVS